MKTLTPKELGEVLRTLPGWYISSGKLSKEWKFATFQDAMKFVNSVADLAEQAGHHPDIDIRYNIVILGLVTHDAGGITAQDAEVAGIIDARLDG